MRSAIISKKPSRQLLHATYFDTPDHLLHRAGFALRIRRSGRKYIQTIKSRGSKMSGLFIRQEWERPVSGNRVMLDPTTPILELLSGAADGLTPAFEVSVERLRWMVEEGGSSIEVVLDRGLVKASDRQAPFCELELELKRGEPQAVFAFARKIAEFVPVRPGVLSKAQRGYGLLGPVIDAFKAEKVDLARDVSPATAYRDIAGLCLHQYILNETRLLAGHQPEALHQARVALRRLRSAIAIFKPMLGNQHLAHVQSELRWLTAALGSTRDIDVLLDTTRQEERRKQLEDACATSHAELAATLATKRVRDLLLELAEWIAAGPWSVARDGLDSTAKCYAQEALHKLRKKVKRRGGDLATLTDVERHDLRKAAKRLRYGVEFFGSLFPEHKAQRRYRKFSASLEKLQDDLGELNDLVSIPVLLERLGLAEAATTERQMLQQRKTDLISKAVQSWADLMDHKAFWQ